MLKFSVICILNGILFGILDGLIHANVFARKLFEVYKPIARSTVNVPAGLILDLLYGFIMGFIFILLYRALPGDTGVVKGISFALIAWFFRVFMSAVSSWMMFSVPWQVHLYTAITGLLEMLVIGIIYGLFIKPFIHS